MRPRVLAALTLVVATVASSRAAAQTPAERALAESLFREGRQLLARGAIAEACRKLEESQRLDPVGGTLLNLATCHEKEGKIATAWAEYQGALELARRARRRDRIVLAQRKVEQLAPRVPHVVITSEGAAPEGLVVELDGVALGAASLGTGLAVDPGEHVIAARADRHLPWETRVSTVEGETTKVVIPALTAEAPPPPPPPPPPDPGGGWMRPTAYVLVGVSAVALAIGGGFGVAAIAEGDTAAERCAGGVCDAQGFAAHEDGRDAATVANVGVALAALAGAGAITLLVLAPDDEDRLSVAVAPVVGPAAVGTRVRVGF